MNAKKVLKSSICKSNSIGQVTQLNTQPITTNIQNRSLMQETGVIKIFIENDSCNRIFLKYKMAMNNNQNIESNIKIPIKVLYQI